jgi:hypothetical protein
MPKALLPTFALGERMVWLCRAFARAVSGGCGRGCARPATVAWGQRCAWLCRAFARAVSGGCGRGCARPATVALGQRRAWPCRRSGGGVFPTDSLVRPGIVRCGGRAGAGVRYRLAIRASCRRPRGDGGPAAVSTQPAGGVVPSSAVFFGAGRSRHAAVSTCQAGVLPAPTPPTPRGGAKAGRRVSARWPGVLSTKASLPPEVLPRRHRPSVEGAAAGGRAERIALLRTAWTWPVVRISRTLSSGFPERAFRGGLPSSELLQDPDRGRPPVLE